MYSEIPIGIDLGTTFSAVSYIDYARHTVMIRNSEGDILTPSVVLFGDNEVVVGKEARTAATVHPGLVAEWVKRDMGSPFYSRPIHGQTLPPEVIQGCILRKLKLDIQRKLGNFQRVVVTVPAYFDEVRRKGTADAGEMAGLKVFDIVNEPTAAALAFGETLGYLSPGGSPKDKMTIFVYDLGGGTFDATLLKLAPGDIRTLATDGDVMLGGHDWDMRLANYAADAFQQEHGLNPRLDPATMNRTLAAVIEAKHTLSARVRAFIRVEMAGKTSEVPIAREQFDDMTADLLERTSYTTRQLLSTAGLEWKDIDRLLLVGGSTRMPMVAGMLRKLTGLEPDHTVNPDEAVARGAALYAGYLLAREDGADGATKLEITNVNSHSLGVEGIDPDTYRKKNVVLIPRNTPLPAKRVERFTTKSDDQRSIVLQVLEGESSIPSECTPIIRTVIRDLPAGLTKGWPIDVTFEYASNGRLNVHAIVSGTGHEAVLDLERSTGISREGIERWKQPIVAAGGFGSFETMVQDVLGLDAPLEKPANNIEAAPLPTNLRSVPGEGQGVRADAGRKNSTQKVKTPEREGEAPAEPKERALPPASAARQEPRPPVRKDKTPADPPIQVAAPFPSVWQDPSHPKKESRPSTPAESLIPQRKLGASAKRTFALKPQSLSDSAPIWQEKEDIPVNETVEFNFVARNDPPRASTPPARKPLSRILLNIAGFIVFSACGLALGYVILHYIQPDRFKWPWL